MSEQLKQIAQRLACLRDIEGLSQEAVAKEFGISVDAYISYENGSTDIPVSFLYEFAHRFGVELTSIISGDEPRLKVYSVVRKGKGLNVERRKDYIYQNLAYNFSHKKMEPFIVTVPPENTSKPIPQSEHPGQEYNYVLEGCLKIVINNTEILLNEGDSIYFDSAYPHGMQAMNNKEAKFLAIIL